MVTHSCSQYTVHTQPIEVAHHRPQFLGTTYVQMVRHKKNSCVTFALLYCPFLFLVYCIFFVIGLVGLCCKPQPLVIIIIIIYMYMAEQSNFARQG